MSKIDYTQTRRRQYTERPFAKLTDDELHDLQIALDAAASIAEGEREQCLDALAYMADCEGQDRAFEDEQAAQ